MDPQVVVGSCNGCPSTGRQVSSEGMIFTVWYPGGLGVGEQSALRAQGVEVGQAEVAGAVFEDLVVGELVEDDPDQQGMVCGGGWGVVLHAAVIWLDSRLPARALATRSCAML